jgi:hypothetical protein
VAADEAVLKKVNAKKVSFSFDMLGRSRAGATGRGGR